MPSAHVAALLCASGACTASCAEAPARAPVARIVTTPTAILVHDDFETRVTIDGSISSVLEGSETPLEYHWRFEDDEARTDDALDREQLVVTFRGDRPPRIVLTVTSPAGVEGTVEHLIGLTVRR